MKQNPKPNNKIPKTALDNAPIFTVTEIFLWRVLPMCLKLSSFIQEGNLLLLLIEIIRFFFLFLLEVLRFMNSSVYWENFAKDVRCCLYPTLQVYNLRRILYQLSIFPFYNILWIEHPQINCYSSTLYNFQLEMKKIFNLHVPQFHWALLRIASAFCSLPEFIRWNFASWFIF